MKAVKLTSISCLLYCLYTPCIQGQYKINLEIHPDVRNTWIPEQRTKFCVCRVITPVFFTLFSEHIAQVLKSLYCSVCRLRSLAC